MGTMNQNLTDSRRLKESQQRLRMPIRATVVRSLPGLEALEVEMALNPGTTRFKVHHPYYGPNSWIRVSPESGTEVLTLQRGDETQDEIIAYNSVGAVDKLAAYKENLVLFRPLDAGEIEIMSSGRAYMFFGSGGDIELRGATIRQELLQSRLELRSVAPTYARRLHRSAPDTLSHEERFGVIKRPDTRFPNSLQQYIRIPFTAKSAADAAAASATAAASGASAIEIAAAALPEFAVEYGRWLNLKNDDPLAEYQEGHVVDQSGQLVKQSSTNKYLRSQRKLYHVLLGDLTYQIDEELNILFNNSSTSTETKVNLGTLNALKLSSKDVKLLITKTGQLQFGVSLTTKAPTTTINAATLLTGKSARIHLNAPNVGFGSSPLLPLALATPMTGSMSTAIGIMQTFIATIGVALPPLSGAAATAIAALGQVTATLSQVPSTQVKATA